jgi:hypothetical protein
MAERERREGGEIDGTQLMVDASHLAGADLDPWKALARALDLLRREQCIIWQSPPPSATSEPDGPLDPDRVRAMRSIRVSATGRVMCLAAASQSPAQINIFNNSSVGQVGMGENRIGDVHLLFARAQEALDRLDVPDDLREEARSMLGRLQSAASDVATPAAASVLALALEQAMHLH